MFIALHQSPRVTSGFHQETPRTNDVVHRRLGRHTLGLGDLPHAIRAKGALRVDVNHLERGDGSRGAGAAGDRGRMAKVKCHEVG